MKIIFLLAIILLNIFYTKLLLINCARLLVVLPTPSYGHNLIYKTIYKELSLRGHELVVFTTDLLNNSSLTNIKEIDMSFLYKKYTYFNESYETIFNTNRIMVVDKIKKISLEITREIYLHPEMKLLINNNSKEHFDLLLMEWNGASSLVALSKRFNCPIIGLSALGLNLEGHDVVGNPTNPSYIPVGWMDFNKEDFWGRMDNFLFSIIWRLHHHFIVLPKAEKIAKEFLPENYSKNILEIEKNVSIILTNTHPILTGARPLVPAIIEIGGIHLKKEKKPIPKDVQEYLNNAHDGVVYINLGSSVKNSNLNPSILKIIISSLSELPYKVIWKWENNSFKYNLPLNVKIWDWLPQESILGHPNVKVLITHGGLLSIMEAVDNHIPMVGIPFLADQFINVNKFVKLKIGKRLDIKNFKKKTFLNAVKKVIQNPIYKENIQKVESIFNDFPMEPLDKAIWWIEYVLRHKGALHMRSPAVHMNWIEYLLLDIIALCIILILFVIFIVYYVLLVLSKKPKIIKLKVN